MLGFLASDYFRESPMLAFPVIGMVLFMAVFTAATVRALRMKRNHLDRMAQMPLEADDG